MTLQRRNGRWLKRPPHYRKESCSLLTSYKLLRPVFGGSRRRGGLRVVPCDAARARGRDRHARPARRRPQRMRVRRADITYRVKLQPGRLPRGDYRFVLRVRPLGGGRTLRSVLTSRRL